MEHRPSWRGNRSSDHVVGPLSPHHDMTRPQSEHGRVPTYEGSCRYNKEAAANSPQGVLSNLEYEQGMPTACHREF
jgi:hypothetical protein